MGRGIALVAAKAGFQTRVVEPNAAAAESARADIDRILKRARDKGEWDAATVAGILDRLQWSGSLDAAKGAALVIEAVPEHVGLKAEVYAGLAPHLSPDAVDIIGGGTGGVNGSNIGSNRNCFNSQAAGTRFLNLEIFNCPKNAIQLQNGNNCTVSGCYLHDSASAGIFSASSGGHIFTRNEFASHGARGVEIHSGSTTISFNHFHDHPTVSIEIAGGGADSIILGNLVRGGSTSVLLTEVNAKIAHNTLVSAATTAIQNSTTGTDVRNNLIAFIGGYAITGSAAAFSFLDDGIAFSASSGICASCGAGANFTIEDPLFVSSGALDFTLSPGSPAINAGTDLGYDVNGSRAGDFDGIAPDYGAFEFEE
jgi:parallel beta-helix repeat protein